MIIEKHYGETVEISKNRWIKLGVTLKSNKELSTPDEIKIHSQKLLLMGKKLVQDDIKTLKEEEQNG